MQWGVRGAVTLDQNYTLLGVAPAELKDSRIQICLLGVYLTELPHVLVAETWQGCELLSCSCHVGCNLLNKLPWSYY